MSPTISPPPILSAPSSAPVDNADTATTDNDPNNNDFNFALTGNESEFVKADEKNSMAGIVVGSAVGTLALVAIFVIFKLVTKQRRKQHQLDDCELDIESSDGRTKGGATAVTDETSLLFQGHENAPQPFNLTGEYKMAENENLDGFLEAVGVPWAVRSMAAKTLSKHSVVHRGNLFTVKFKGIPRSTYVLGGPPTETCVRDTRFQDVVRYSNSSDALAEANQGVTASGSINNMVWMVKRPIGADYEIHFQWTLIPGGKASLSLTSTAHFDDGRPVVKSVQRYKRKDQSKKTLAGSPSSISDPFSDMFSDTCSVFSEREYA